jgi:hypothetical protein
MSGEVFSVAYIRVHPDFQKKENVRIYLAPDEINIAPITIKIKYNNIEKREENV